MTNPGLDNRLRQHSRRAGIIIGLSMALTIAMCIGGFAVIYAKIDPFTRDFVNAATITPTPPPTKAPKASKSNGNAAAADNSNAAVEIQPTDTPVPAQPSPTATSTGFNPDYRVSSDVRVNLRSGPSRGHRHRHHFGFRRGTAILEQNTGFRQSGCGRRKKLDEFPRSRRQRGLGSRH